MILYQHVELLCQNCEQNCYFIILVHIYMQLVYLQPLGIGVSTTTIEFTILLAHWSSYQRLISPNLIMTLFFRALHSLLDECFTGGLLIVGQHACVHLPTVQTH